MDGERCPDCDRVIASQHDYDSHESGCCCERCVSLCWRLFSSDICESPAVDWRSRALAAEAERDRLAEKVRDLEESWVAFAIVAGGSNINPIRYQKFDGCLSRNYGWTHSNWSLDVGFHATPREAVDAAWRHGWDAETRAQILMEHGPDQFRNVEVSRGK